MYISYKGFLGSTFSDYLPAGQADSLSANLIAGTTYYLDVASASTPLDISIAFNGQVLGEHTFVPAGDVFTFTPSVSGVYGLGVDTAMGNAGSYTLVGVPAVHVTDTTTGVSSLPPMHPYGGPVAGLADEYINLTSDNINITATTPNVFLHSGAGEDALQVSAGTNVLDGSTGSNFLVGGTGPDTFFIDDRNAPADIWSTLVNFHSGDAATIWGVSPNDFNFSYRDNDGAAGFTGLTITASAPGRANASLTLAGYSTNDLSNGRLSTSFGFDPASGSPYAYIHANLYEGLACQEVSS
jgi:Ca2+-binding RTX toxin-like protein